jgi:alkaline phosphatase D
MKTLGFQSPQREGFADVMAARDTQELLGVLNDALREQNPHLKNINLTDHGYTLLDITPEKAQGDYWYMDTILVPSVRERFGGGFFTLNGQNNLTRSATPTAPKPVQAVPAPARPLRTTLVAQTRELAPQAGSKRSANDASLANKGTMLLLGCYPNPMNSVGYINYTLDVALPVTVNIYDAMGKIVSTLVNGQVQQGNIVLMLDASRFPTGAYTCSIETPQSSIKRALIVRH